MDAMKSNSTLHVLALIVLVMVCTSAHPTTWYVDRSVSESSQGQSWESAFKRIYEGIFAGNDGDTVIVAQGNYVENINFRGKNIVLRSTNPLDPEVVANTIIDGDEWGAVVTFSGDEDETCVLTGFTIQNGKAWKDGGGVCGGTSDNRTHATIRDNLITGNSAPLFGGGVACCDGLIRNNTIQLNSAYDGGGVAYCSGAIRDNTVQWNSAEYKAGGLFDCDGIIEGNIINGNNSANLDGGLAHCSGTIENNMISANSADWGGGIGDCSAAILRNIIIRNSATDRAGGIGACDGIIRSNVVAGNSAGWGAGLASCDGMIVNNTITRNSTTGDGGGLSFCHGSIANCIIWGNMAPAGAQLDDSSVPTYSCIQDWDGGGEGNIVLDPQFLDPNGPDNNFSTYGDNDYRLLPDSPCVDEGANSVLTPPGLDLDENLRIALGRQSLTVDMGAFEYNSKPFAVTHFDFVTIPRPGGRRLTWNSQPNDTYTVWFRYSLQATKWYRVKTVASQGAATSCTDKGLLLWNWRALFYRVEMK